MFEYPDSCPVCGSVKLSSSAVCPDCRAQLDSECFDSFMSRCPVCMYPLLSPLYKCTRCGGAGTFRVYPVADYGGSLGYSVLDSFKFHGHREMAKVGAAYLSRALSALDPEGRAVLVPVPCSRARLRRFGWDQMAEICKALGRPYASLLKQRNSSYSIQQKKLDRAGRQAVSEGKFIINPRFRGKMPDKGTKLIVIDDVVTTGSTMNAAITVLREYGYEDVDGAGWFAEL